VSNVQSSCTRSRAQAQNAKFRVVIDAQIASGWEGGIEQVLIGLCHGFDQFIDDRKDDFIVVGRSQDGEWIQAYVGRNMKYVRSPPPPGQSIDRAKDLLGPLRRPLGIARRAVTRAVLGKDKTKIVPLLPTSNGFYESLMPHILHITYPLNFVRSSIPTILTMHDLQHRHFPEFFSPEVMQWRESVYPEMLSFAKGIIAISKFCKDDIIRQYDIPASKIFVIPLAPPIEAYAPVTEFAKSAVVKKYQLPKEFMLYPALTYEHKNHVRLLEALALLRAEGRRASLVCTGAKRHHWPKIQRRIKDLGIEGDVKFLGFVSASELAAMYELAQFVILPSLFEGAGLPLLEAFKARKPVTCSNIAAFREYGADAPSFFDPLDSQSIAGSIRAMLENADMRANLAERGTRRVAEFTWRRSAWLHSAVYRKIAGLALSSEEEQALCVA
jgi:glycosyltransferase involved in cell wall biosynthesis